MPPTMEQWNWGLNPSLSESHTCPSFPQPATMNQWGPRNPAPGPKLTQSSPSHSLNVEPQSPAPYPKPRPQIPISPSLLSPPRTQGIWLLALSLLCSISEATLPSSHPGPLTSHGHEHGKGSEDPSQALAAEEEGAVGGRHGAQLPEEAALQNCTEGCGGTRIGAATQLGRPQGLPGGGVSRVLRRFWTKLAGMRPCYSGVTTPIHSSSEAHP